MPFGRLSPRLDEAAQLAPMAPVDQTEFERTKRQVDKVARGRVSFAEMPAYGPIDGAALRMAEAEGGDASPTTSMCCCSSGGSSCYRHHTERGSDLMRPDCDLPASPPHVATFPVTRPREGVPELLPTHPPLTRRPAHAPPTHRPPAA